MYIAPHLSTGGMPQYLFKQIESVINDFDVYCIEWDNVTGGVLVVQRNKIQQILGDRLITLGEPKQNLFTILNRIKPDVVHLQEIPELFMGTDIADTLYSATRTYTIIETSHDSSYDVNNKRYFPDKFLMVSNYQVQMYKTLGVPIDIVEYPIEQKVRTKTREQALRNLGLDPNLKHVINVGLFTPRKNQAEVIEYARQLQHYPIQFHFIGNQADNFKHYWEPLMQNFPKNCNWWNERSDVDSFYEAADLFLFTSKGHDRDKETMPLVIREALGWKTPTMLYNLPVYMGYFDKYDTIEYLQDDTRQNTYRIAEKLLQEPPPQHNIASQDSHARDCIIITAHPTSAAASALTKQSILDAKQFGLPVILTCHCPVPLELQALVDYCIVDTNNILTTHTYYNTFWSNTNEYYVSVNLRGAGNDVYHGPAVQTNYHNAIAFAQVHGFQNAYCWNYDVLIKHASVIDDIRNALRSHSLITHYYRAEEGMCAKTVIFGTNIEFFLQTFPTITKEHEYTEWMQRVGSESNGLENMWYHTLKHHSRAIKLWSEAEYNHLLRTNDMDSRSMVEYTTVLPIEHDTERAMAWFSSNNTTDRRVLRIYGNDVMLHSAEITNKSQCYIPISLTDTNTVTFEIVDADAQNIIQRKVIPVSIDSIANNGVFRYKR